MALDTNSASRSDSPPKYVNEVYGWIKACDKLHGDTCVPESIQQRPPEEVPAWLIDTQLECIVPGISANRYLALSYVWPEARGSSDSDSSSPHTLLLDNESLADFKIPGFLGKAEALQRIPMVIRHAMKLTYAIGERYLWVDRLCIVQNDFRDGGTLSQVAKMDKTYGGAYLAIIAAAPEETYEQGLFLEPQSLDWPRTRYSKGLSYSNDQEDELSFDNDSQHEEMSKEAITRAMAALYNRLSESRWATRGWTYQEQILCKRAIVFTKTGCFWDCQCCVWDGSTLKPGQDFAGVALRADLGQRFSTRWWPDFSFYIDLICPYNGREFSYPQDARLGILGILTALEKSFPGGFVHGLPRLFLDHALLWQPFVAADRRMDRSEDGARRSSLPSWSWCGWQCFVDPWSLRSGLSYICENDCEIRAGSWRTRNLVEWSISAGDGISERIVEPHVFDQYVDIIPDRDFGLRSGWMAQDVPRQGISSKSTDKRRVYTHEKGRDTTFKHPIPLQTGLSAQRFVTVPAYLTCSTTTTSFYPATVLRRAKTSKLSWFGPEKISVFETKLFQSGPPDEKTCPILVMQQPNGRFAGLLRLMSQEHINESTRLELIAVSTGSVIARDLIESLEWRVFEKGSYPYDTSRESRTIIYTPDWISEKGKHALLFDFAMAFDKHAAGNGPVMWDLDASLVNINQDCDKRIEKAVANNPGFAYNTLLRPMQWFEALKASHWEVTETPNQINKAWHPVNRKAWGSSFQTLIAQHLPLKLGDIVCEFYNVLWIERRDGIAYRRACGWVPKYIWEAYANGPVEIKLG
jgi:Heterokaryon incompatibility protein (HET)